MPPISGTLPNYRSFIRYTLASCLADVRGIAFQEAHNDQEEYPRGAFRCGSIQWIPSESGDARSETGMITALLRVEMQVGEDESLDDIVGALENEVERAIKRFDLPPPLDHPYYITAISNIDRTNNVPTMIREKGLGTILFPVVITFTVHWK